MNRVFVFGVAVFFAIVGIALLGGEKQAVAGHGCNGCHGAVACDGAASCCAPAACWVVPVWPAADVLVVADALGCIIGELAVVAAVSRSLAVVSRPLAAGPSLTAAARP